MNKDNFFLTLGVAAVVVGILALIYLNTSEGPKTGRQSPRSSQSSSSDSTAAINADVENLNLGDVDSEFTDIDADINSL